MKASFAALLAALTLMPYVSAHGSVSKVVIDGKAYAGNAPNTQSPGMCL